MPYKMTLGMIRVVPMTNKDVDRVIRIMMPCSHKIKAILGFPEPTLIACGKIAGHEQDGDEWHEYTIRWKDNGSN